MAGERLATMARTKGTTSAVLSEDVFAADCPRGDAELAGATIYNPSGIYGVAQYVTCAASMTFDRIRLSLGCVNLARQLRVRVFEWPSLYNYAVTDFVPLHDETLTAGAVPPHLTPVTIVLSAPVTVQAGKTCVVLISSTVAQDVITGYYTTDPTGDRQFYYTLNSSGQLQISGSGYWAGGMRLIGTEDPAHTVTTTYQHVRAPVELTGSSTYGVNSIKFLAMYEPMVVDTTFDTVQAAVWCTNATRPVTMYVWERDDLSPFTPRTTPALATINYPAGSFPVANDKVHSFVLPASVTVHAGKYCVVGFYNPLQSASAELYVTRFATAASGSPARHEFILGASENVNWSLSGLPTYGQATFTLTYKELTSLTVADALNGIVPAVMPFIPRAGMISTTVGAALVEAYQSGGGGGGATTAAAVTYDHTTSGLASANVQDAIDELEASPAPRVILPDSISAVVGDELQLFTRGMIEAEDPLALPFDYVCSVGNDYRRYFDYTPAAAGTHSLAVTVRDVRYRALGTGTTNIVAVTATGQPAANKNILCIGDSLTSGHVWPEEAWRRLCGSGGTPAGRGYSNLTFIGDNPFTAAPTQKCVGYGGWTYAYYLGTSSDSAYWVTCTHDKGTTDQHSTWVDANAHQWTLETIESGRIKFTSGSTAVMPAANAALTWVSGGSHHATISYTVVVADASSPFWDPTAHAFSFSYFCTANGYSGIDAVYVLLGWNSIPSANASEASNHTSAMADARAFLDQLHIDYPSAVARVMGIQVPSPIGGLGANYGATGTYSAYYGLLRSVNGQRLAYQSLCDEVAYSSWVRYIDIAAQFDSDNNMQLAATAVNTRNAATENRGTNGVHPATAGYYQIADAAYRDIIRTFCSA